MANTFAVRIKRWSGREDVYVVESYGARPYGLILDFEDGMSRIDPWAQIIAVEIDPPEPQPEPISRWSGGM